MKQTHVEQWMMHPLKKRNNRTIFAATIKSGTRRYGVLWCSALLLLCISCTDTDSQVTENEDTDSSLDATVAQAVDNRWIPTECAVVADCDDGDPCTAQRCMQKKCVYEHQGELMQVQSLEIHEPAISGPVVDASIIGNRIYTVVSGAEPGIQHYSIPEDDVPIFREKAVTAFDVLAVEATWDGFIAVEGSNGMEVFSTDSLESPVYSSLTKERVLSHIDTAVNVSISSSYAYIAGYEEGVTVLTGELNGPTHLGTVDTIGRAVTVAARGGAALIADSLGGAVSVYLQEDAPVLGTVISTTGRVVDADVNRSSGIIGEYGAGFSLVDFSSASEPERLSRVATDAPVVAVRMIGPQTALVFLENGEVMKVGFLDYQTPLLLDTIHLDSAPAVRGVDFYNGTGVITLENGKVSLITDGCTYE